MLQIAGKKRYVPILPMIPLPDTPPHSSTPPVTPPTSHHLRQPRVASTKRPWQGYDRGGYKRECRQTLH
ncbi:hypothetical protein E2C01_078350 [Portunus trituberculatus]|uniref:Uncharacterized protein n=1 Tax=Portunus trituberculatus TaxID=210409 RepID=A0A5B7IPX2_PORTR|nr:hypothetical protein [Portunus trituberculatus]